MKLSQGNVAAAVAFVAGLAAALGGCGGGGPRTLDREVSPEIVEGGAVFRYVNSDAKKVFLVGDFNNWTPNSDPMKDLNGDGHWSLFYPLRPGTYQYKYVVDGRWIPDPRNADDEPDGFDGVNSVVTVPEMGGG